MRAFDNFSDARQAVYDNVLEAAKAIKPVEFGGRKLEVVDAFYDPNDVDDDTTEAFTPASQARAIYEEKTLGRRLRGRIRMTDLSTGKSDEIPTTLALVPRINEDGTNIYRGSRYVVVNQQRLKPGVFGRIKKNQNVESYINADKQTGLTHRVVFKPEKSMFYLNVGNSHVPLVSLLRTMGTTDEELHQAWGEEIARANIAASKDADINKIYDRLVRSKDKVKDADTETKKRIIAQAVQNVGIDPWVTKRTLGIETDKLSPQVFLRASQKSLDMLRGNLQGDDRDSLSSQQVRGVEDLFAERIKLDSGFDQRNAFRTALARNNINAVPRRLLQRQLEEVLFGSGVAIQPDNANPLQAWDLATRITKMGDGAIGSSTAVPMESRDFHGSHIGFIDPSRTVESLKVGVDLNLAANAVKGKDGKVYTPLKNVRTGQIEYKSAEDIADSVIASQMYEDVPGFITAVKGGEEDYYTPDEIEYVIPDVESGFSGVANLIPGKLMQPQNRTAMGARFITQSIPLLNREAPLVQSAVPGTNKSLAFNKLYNSRVGVVSAKSPGVVKSVASDRIVVTHAGADGTPVDKVYHLHESTPIGPKTSLSNTPVVKPGDQVDKDTVLAASNYSDANGNIAIGLNARMALMPWKDNYEDAYVVSQSFAKKMTSEQNYTFKSYSDPDAVTRSDKFLSVLPSEYSKAQISKLDADGVVKVGEKVSSGDPIVLSAGVKDINMSKPLAKSGHRAYVNNSQVWDHDDEGVVTGVYRDKRGNVHVSVKTNSAMVDGDKIAEFFGSKGVVRVLPDDQMVHDSEGRPFDVVASDLGTISRQNSSRAVAMLLGKVAEKTGQPYLIDESDPNVDYRDVAREELAKHGLSDRETVIDPRNGRKIPNVLAGPQYIMKLTHLAESKAHARSSGVYSCFDDKTEVLTRAGWINWAAANTSTEFAAVDAYGQLCYELPTKLTAAKYDGQLVGFQGRFVDYLVTPNHRMWVRCQLRSDRRGTRAYGQFFFQTAGEIFDKKARRVVRQGGLTPDVGLQSLSSHVTIDAPPSGKFKRRKYQPIQLSVEDYAELIGWFVAEGSLSSGKRNDYAIYITQYKSANPEKFARIEQLLRKLGLRYTYGYNRKRSPLPVAFRIRSKQLYYHLLQFGAGCENKRIPRFVFELPLVARQRLLESLILGDGSSHLHEYGRETKQFTTTSKQLADDVQELLLRTGLGGSVSTASRLTKRGKPVYVVGVFVTRKDGYVTEQARSSAKHVAVNYKGFVYCANVPSGLLIVRRNGKVIVTGNSDETPSKGSEEGMQAKRISNQELGALVSHGATNLLHEIAAVKGTKSTDYMARYLSGRDLPTPQVPFVYKKFLTYLEGLGVNPVKTGSKTRLYLMTDQEVSQRTGKRVVTSDQTVDLAKNMKPVPGGLFDPSIFGDDGQKMARYELTTPIPHPMMQKPLQKIMDLTENQFRDLIAGKYELPGYGTGVEGMQRWLSNLDVDAAKADCRRKIQAGARTTRDKAIQKLKYLTAVEKHGITPDKLILKNIPIIPPVYRPVSKLDGNDTPLIDGLNLLYQQMIMADKNVKSMSRYSATAGNEKLALYDSVKAVTGLEEPADPELRQKAVKGIMRRLVGSSPKTSYVQSKLLSGTVDHVARAVVVPSADLKLDEIGLPESQAWEIFKFPVIRAMTRRGISLERAKAEVDAKSPTARQALLQEMDRRPVTASRAPVLHKYGMLGFNAKLVPGHTLQMNPLVHAGYNLDHDGDTMNFHATITDEAADEVKKKMLPSKNLFAAADFKTPMNLPRQDHALGLWLASTARDDQQRERVFRTVNDAAAAFQRGEININTPVKVLE